MAVLPPEVNAERFAAAILRFQDIVGSKWLFTSDDDLHAYGDHFSYMKDQPNEPVPSAAVGPDRVEQVQEIVRTANDRNIISLALREPSIPKVVIPSLRASLSGQCPSTRGKSDEGWNY